ncbi:class A sortase [Streptococcus gallolyticus]|uniref:Sortase A, LPXTG specific n=1 Tax=Streptococcus gallolyticus TaxID=315405 RepID=A0A139R3C4_9STRE|nr:sortase [Streptococcus gallolyticus]KXT64464.1 Sortase A, LPXTG specific [Streptococcus gallolyticus]KXU09164.1 Sortase A, LPXTG specific [Streptococcus gallolyticus]
MKKKIIMLLMIVIGFLLLFSKPISHYVIGLRSNDYQVSQVSKATIAKNETTEATYDFSSVQSVSMKSLLTSDGTDLLVIGGIAVPDLSINLPIFKGVTNDNLLYGAGTMKENQVMGGENNYALASHHVFGLTGSSQMLFSPLEKAKVGMTIYLTDKSMVYTYKITEIVSVSPEQTEVLDDVAGQSTLTLVTCEDKEATKRLIVKASLTDSKAYQKATKVQVKAFSYSYNQIQ